MRTAGIQMIPNSTSSSRGAFELQAKVRPSRLEGDIGEAQQAIEGEAVVALVDVLLRKLRLVGAVVRELRVDVLPRDEHHVPRIGRAQISEAISY